MKQEFVKVVEIIRQARIDALKTVNRELINLYWNIGSFISSKVESEQWGKSVVQELARYIAKTEPGLKGFSDKNIWRMKQFYETYCHHPNLSALLRQISWTNNLLIMGRANTQEEREFYIKLCIKEHYSSRELDRQINSGIFERVALGKQKLSSSMRENSHLSDTAFKDSYIFEFLNLPEQHSEEELQKALVAQFTRLVLAGVFDRFPNLQVILGHWGEVILFYTERLASLAKIARLEKPFIDYVRQNLYVTASGMFSKAYLRRTIDIIGSSRILFSSDYPYQYRPGRDARNFLETAELNAEEKENFAFRNWERLINAIA